MTRSDILAVFALALFLPTYVQVGATASPESSVEQNKVHLSAQDKALASLNQIIDPFGDNELIKKRVRDLVTQLGHERFRDREKATRALLEMDPAISPLLAEAERSEDPEVSLRARQILSELKATAANVGEEINASIDTLIRAENTRLPPLLLELMEHRDERVRYYAAHGMRRATGQVFGFSAHARPASREQSIRKWKDWWKGVDASFKFAPDGAVSQPLGIVIADDIGKQILLIDFQGRLLWSHKLDFTPKAATILPNGHYLIAHNAGACEFNRNHEKIWDINKAGLGQKMTYDIERLANGNTLVSYVSDGHVTELDRDGKIVWQMKGLKSPGAAQRLPSGNTLISENHSNRVIEVDADSRELWTFPNLKNPSDVRGLANGNVLVGEWGANRAIEVNREKKIVWTYQTNGNVTSAHRLADGNTVVVGEGTIDLVDDQGKKIRPIHEGKRKYGKVKLVPIPKTLPKQ